MCNLNVPQWVITILKSNQFICYIIKNYQKLLRSILPTLKHVRCLFALFFLDSYHDGTYNFLSYFAFSLRQVPQNADKCHEFVYMFCSYDLHNYTLTFTLSLLLICIICQRRGRMGVSLQ